MYKCIGLNVSECLGELPLDHVCLFVNHYSRLQFLPFPFVSCVSVSDLVICLLTEKECEGVVLHTISLGLWTILHACNYIIKYLCVISNKRLHITIVHNVSLYPAYMAKINIANLAV